MNIRTISLLSFAALLAAASGCQTRQAGVHADSVVAPAASRTSSPFSASDVFTQIGIEDVSNAVLMARTSDGEQAVVTGRRGAKHVAAVAYRHPYSPVHPWRVRFIQYKMTDGGCLWYYAKDEYDRPPTRDDIIDLLKRVRAQQTVHDFIFAETGRCRLLRN